MDTLTGKVSIHGLSMDGTVTAASTDTLTEGGRMFHRWHSNWHPWTVWQKVVSMPQLLSHPWTIHAPSMDEHLAYHLSKYPWMPQLLCHAWTIHACLHECQLLCHPWTIHGWASYHIHSPTFCNLWNGWLSISTWIMGTLWSIVCM